MRLSKSKVNTYLKCPLEFKFQYIDEIESKPNKYMALGSDVHLIAEKFTEKFEDNLDDIDIENELLGVARELDLGYGLEEHIDNLGLFFREIFVDSDYKLFSNEEYLFDKKNRFSGICDIILEDENGKLTVIDYKTSSSNSFSKYRLELCYYKLLVENVYHRQVNKVGVFFTKNGRLRLLDISENENKRKYLSYCEIDDAIRTLQDVRDKISRKEFPKKKQYLCRYCTYRNLCEDEFFFFR